MLADLMIKCKIKFCNIDITAPLMFCFYFSDGSCAGIGMVGCGPITALAWCKDSQHILAATEHGVVVGWSLIA